MSEAAETLPPPVRMAPASVPPRGSSAADAGPPLVSAAAIALAAIIFFAAWTVALPLHRDTALFAFFADRMAEGDVLYRDLLDSKQPGIFLFFRLGLLLPLPPSVGIRLVEIVWMLALAVAQMLALRSVFSQRWMATLPPLITLVAYYGLAEPNRLTQVEALIWLPLFSSAALTAAAVGRTRSLPLLFVAGVCGGVAAMFKLPYCVIPILFLIVAGIHVRRDPLHKPSWAAIGRQWLVFAAGGFAPFLACALWLGVEGALVPFLWWTFVFPFDYVAVVGGDPVVLIGSFVHLAAAFLAWAPLLVFAALATRVGRTPPIVAMMWGWTLLGVVLMVAQKPSWWTYHTLLVYCPLAVLAVVGLDEVLRRLRSEIDGDRRRATALLPLLLVFPGLAGYAYPAGEGARRLVDRFLAGDDLLRYQAAVDGEFAASLEAAEYLRRQDVEGPIFVFGDPNLHLLTGRASAAAIHGQYPPMLSDALWARTIAELEARCPPFVYIEPAFDDFLRTRYPPFVRFFTERYTPVWSGSGGRWYRDAACPRGD